MLKSLYVNNYKSFVNFRIEFDKVSVLIGKNGSGKSNLLLLIASICSFVRGQSNSLVTFARNTLTRWMNSDIQTFVLCVEKGGDIFEYSLEIIHLGNDQGCKVHSESISKNGVDVLLSESGRALLFSDVLRKEKELLVDGYQSCIFLASGFDEYRSISEFRSIMDEVVFCVPNPKLMNDVVINDIYVPQPDFSNIASAYLGITQLDPEIIHNLWNAVKETDSTFVKSKINMDKYSKYLTMVYKYNDREYSFRFGELSDGEKMLFSLYLLLYGYVKQGQTVLLDEPDNYLSLKEIQPWCIEVDSICEESGQCILISHHPEVIDYYAENNGIWVSKLSSGETIVEDDPYYDRNEEKGMLYSELMARKN